MAKKKHIRFELEDYFIELAECYGFSVRILNEYSVKLSSPDYLGTWDYYFTTGKVVRHHPEYVSGLDRIFVDHEDVFIHINSKTN